MECIKFMRTKHLFFFNAENNIHFPLEMPLYKRFLHHRNLAGLCLEAENKNGKPLNFEFKNLRNSVNLSIHGGKKHTR